MRTEQEVVSTINHLLEVCNERTQGYRKAAENVKDPELASVFEGYAIETNEFANELLPYSNEFRPEDVGTRVIGDAWRVWMDLKAAITGGGKAAMLGACITGEEAAIRNYEDALDEDLPSEVRNIVEKHLEKIKRAYENVKSYKDKV